jgi:hypothetical protein
MSRFYLVNEEFTVPLRDMDNMEDDVINLIEGDIIEVRFYNNDMDCMLKIINTEYFYDSHLSIDFITVNYFLFTDVTNAVIRDRKLDSIIKKRA